MSNASHEFHRQPAGRPAGGQFAEATKPSSGLSLDRSHSSRDVAALEQVAYKPTVRIAELNDLLDHHQPVCVRAAVARTPYPGVAEKASYDPEPLVRALAMEGWDLSAASRQRLAADEGVGQVLRVLRA